MTKNETKTSNVVEAYDEPVKPRKSKSKKASWAPLLVFVAFLVGMLVMTLVQAQRPQNLGSDASEGVNCTALSLSSCTAGENGQYCELRDTGSDVTRSCSSLTQESCMRRDGCQPKSCTDFSYDNCPTSCDKTAWRTCVGTTPEYLGCKGNYTTDLYVCDYRPGQPAATSTPKPPTATPRPQWYSRCAGSACVQTQDPNLGKSCTRTEDCVGTGGPSCIPADTCVPSSGGNCCYGLEKITAGADCGSNNAQMCARPLPTSTPRPGGPTSTPRPGTPTNPPGQPVPTTPSGGGGGNQPNPTAVPAPTANWSVTCSPNQTWGNLSVDMNVTGISPVSGFRNASFQMCMQPGSNSSHKYVYQELFKSNATWKSTTLAANGMPTWVCYRLGSSNITTLNGDRINFRFDKNQKIGGSAAWAWPITEMANFVDGHVRAGKLAANPTFPVKVLLDINGTQVRRDASIRVQGNACGAQEIRSFAPQANVSMKWGGTTKSIGAMKASTNAGWEARQIRVDVNGDGAANPHDIIVYRYSRSYNPNFEPNPVKNMTCENTKGQWIQIARKNGVSLNSFSNQTHYLTWSPSDVETLGSVANMGSLGEKYMIAVNVVSQNYRDLGLDNSVCTGSPALNTTTGKACFSKNWCNSPSTDRMKEGMYKWITINP